MMRGGVYDCLVFLKVFLYLFSIKNGFAKFNSSFVAQKLPDVHRHHDRGNI